MTEYIVNIRMTEDNSIKVEADNVINAVSEAFNQWYAWASENNANSFEVEVRECGDGLDAS